MVLVGLVQKVEVVDAGVDSVMVSTGYCRCSQRRAFATRWVVEERDAAVRLDIHYFEYSRR